MIIILLIIFLIICSANFMYLTKGGESEFVAVICITSLAFSLILFSITLVRLSNISYATDENREDCIRWAKEINNIKSEIIRTDTIKKIKRYNSELKTKQDLNKSFLFDLLIDEEITNLKPIPLRVSK